MKCEWENSLCWKGKSAREQLGLFATCRLCALVVETFIGLCWAAESLVFYGLIPMWCQAYSVSVQLGQRFFPLTPGSNPLLWGKETESDMKTVASHCNGLVWVCMFKECASVWMYMRLTFSHFCDLIWSHTVPLGLRVYVPWHRPCILLRGRSLNLRMSTRPVVPGKR